MKWEYKTVWAQFCPGSKLNELGQEGWELVGAMGETFLFKRPIENILYEDYHPTFNDLRNDPKFQEEMICVGNSGGPCDHLSTLVKPEADTSIIEEKDLVPEHGNDGC